MTIENDEAYLASLWDWACLDGCFGETKIRPTDIDGLVERNGQFLYYETKLPGVPVNTGQNITFTRLLDHECNSLMIVWGHPGRPEKIELRHGKSTRIYENTSLDTLRDITSRWFEWADNQTPAPRWHDSNRL